jgi:hypothetical protein
MIASEPAQGAGVDREASKALEPPSPGGAAPGDAIPSDGEADP